MSKERIKIISLVGLLVFGLLLSGRLIYNNKWVDANLIRQSQAIPGVISVQVVNVAGVQEFNVVTSGVQDLASMSRALKKVAGKLPIRLLDQRSSTLEQVFNQMQFALQEGIARGNFTEMKARVLDIGQKAGVDVRLSMDSEAIYLSLTQGGKQLVSVLNRHGDATFLPSSANSAAKGGQG